MATDARTHVARSFGTESVPRVLTFVSVLYFTFVLLDASGSRIPHRWLPGPLLFFVQDAALFPHADVTAIEHRAEGWRCDDHRWAEIDTRPFFPINADDKESRFDRALFFYFANRPTMYALNDYIVAHYNAAHSTDGQRIGGTRIWRLRVPFGTPGTPEARYVRRALADFPTEQGHIMYQTPASRRLMTCDHTPP